MAISTAVDSSARARVLGIKTDFKQIGNNVFLLPQRVAVVAQGSTAATYATTPQQIVSSKDAGDRYGYGSPIHLISRQLFPENGDGLGTIPVTVYPLEDDGSGVASAGDITPSGTLTEASSFIVRINNIDSEPFTIATGAMTVATVTAAITSAINAVIEMPVVATDNTTDVGLASKWKGTSANDIFVEVVGSTTVGAGFAITQPVGGLVNPDVDAALSQVGDVWETMFVNAFESTDATILGAFSTFGEGRWGALTRKPMVAVNATSEATVATAITIPDGRKTDRTNVQVAAPGSNDLPAVIAGRAVARMAKLANENPPFDYGRQALTGLTPGTDAEQWDYTEKDVALKGGSSTTDVVDGVVLMSDTITYYHPTGETNPAYRYVVDLVKLQNIIFNVDLVFGSPEWDGAPLLNDEEPTTNRSAKKPKMAIAAAANICRGLGLQAILTDTVTTIPLIEAEIDSGNPKRLNVLIPVKLSGNTNIISVDLNFSFFFGTATVVA